MGLWLLDDEKCMVSLAVCHETIEFEALERQKDKISGAQAGVRNAACTVVDQQTQAPQQRVDPRRREAKRQRHGMLFASNSDQPLAS
jgi:hypothetical protein